MSPSSIAMPSTTTYCTAFARKLAPAMNAVRTSLAAVISSPWSSAGFSARAGALSPCAALALLDVDFLFEPLLPLLLSAMGSLLLSSRGATRPVPRR